MLQALMDIAGFGTAGAAESPDDAPLEVQEAVKAFARLVVKSNDTGAIVFLSPELGKWSTVGGLGVMVDELTVGLAALGANVVVISPYYHVNRKGVSEYVYHHRRFHFMHPLALTPLHGDHS